MNSVELASIVEMAKSDRAFYQALATGDSQPTSRIQDLTAALRGGDLGMLASRHNVSSGCNTTSCGCGGSM